MSATLAIAAAGVVGAAHTVLSSITPGARRLRAVERDPRRATVADIELLVRAHGVREDKVWTVVDRVEAADVDPCLVWTWTMHFDGTELADLCGSRSSDDEVRGHLVSCTAPTFCDHASLAEPARLRSA